MHLCITSGQALALNNMGKQNMLMSIQSILGPKLFNQVEVQNLCSTKYLFYVRRKKCLAIIRQQASNKTMMERTALE